MSYIPRLSMLLALVVPVTLFALLIAITPSSVFAADEPAAKVPPAIRGAPQVQPTQTKAQIDKKKLSKSQVKSLLEGRIPDIAIKEVTELANLGLYQVITEDYTSIFVSQDGQDFILGDHFSFDNKGNLKNLSKEIKDKGQFAIVQSLPKAELIIFPAKDKVKKAGWVLVFTDIDCGYCRKLHREIDQINAMGIEVRYAFFPRTGPDTESFKKAISVWCGEDSQASMTAAKAGLPVANKECANPVLSQYETGIKVGVRGTPTIFTQNGKKIPGYLPAAELLTLLGQS